MLNKTQITNLITQGLIHEAFTHEYLGTFDVTEIRNACLAGSYGDPWSSDITQDIIEFIQENRDIDKERVDFFVKNPVYLHDPAIVIECPPDKHNNVITQCIIDGTHRITARSILGMPNFIWYNVPISKATRPTSEMAYTSALDWGEKDFLEKRGIKIPNRIDLK